MGVYYPQVGATLRVVWEDFGNKASVLAQDVYTIAASPKRGRVNINSYTQADTFEIDFDYSCFPFDPRCIRSAQISIHMEDMGSLQNDLGQPQQIELRADTPSAFGPVGKKGNALIIGFADDEGVTLNDSTRTINFKGRDYTSLFLDSPWPGGLIRKDLGPVDVVLKNILAQLPAAGDITLDNRTGIPVLPTLVSLDLGRLAGKKNPQPKQNYWDVIQQVAAEAALIAYIELDKLVLTKPRTLYDRNKAVQFVYGKNIADLEFTRKIGRQKSFNIRVSSYSVEQKRKIVVDIPKDALTLPGAGKEVLIEKVSVKGGVSDKTEEPAPYLSFFVADVANIPQLIARGEKIYEEIARQQIEGKFTTYDFEAKQGDNLLNATCFDLMKLRNGTPVSIEIAPEDLQFINREADVNRRTAFLLKRGYQPKTARALAESLQRFDTPFYTKEVSYSWSGNDAFRIDVDFLNFIETAGLGL